jgi:hypothetical protein
MKTPKQWMKERCVPEMMSESQPTWMDWIVSIQKDATGSLTNENVKLEVERLKDRMHEAEWLIIHAPGMRDDKTREWFERAEKFLKTVNQTSHEK